MAGGVPVLDADGHPIPQFVPGFSRVQRWIPHRGAEFNLTTTSAYVQDRWIVSPKLTLNLGMRFEHAASEATSGPKSLGASRASCRASAPPTTSAATARRCCRPRSRSTRASTTRCSSRETRTSATPTATRWSTTDRPAKDAAFAPGFDVNNYSGVVAGTFPALNVQFADDLSSPLTTEYTFGAARTFGARSYAKVVFVQRKTSNFIEEFITFANGRTPIVVNGATLGQLDNIVYDNSDEMKREYQALQFMGQHRVMNALVRQRPLDGAAEERRELRRRDAESDGLGVRRLSRNAVARAQRSGRPPRRLPAQQGARVGRLSRRARQVRLAQLRADLSLQLGEDLQPRAERPAAQHGSGGSQSRVCGHADAAGLLRRARIAVVRRVCAGRPRGDLRRSGVALGAAVDQVRDRSTC